jgi:SAM-dependent methyltransferase
MKMAWWVADVPSPRDLQDSQPWRRDDGDMATQLDGHDWRVAGDAWGSHAGDWSCFYEHYAVDVLFALFSELGVGPGTRLLDIACGSGLAVRLADGAGAVVSGIDASTGLVGVARARTPAADLRIGSMYELPWPDGTFDVAMSINGIWGGCETALDEAFRVLKPRGLLGLSFWGPGPPLDVKAFFRIFAVNAPEQHRGSMRRLNDISSPGVAEEMLAGSGFEVLGRGGRVAVIEWPDPETAWRGVASLGPAAPALALHDPARLRREVLEALEPLRDEQGIYRSRSDQQFVTARKP